MDDHVIVRGGCHCGSVRFSADVPAGARLLDCNCSICRKAGFLHLIVPQGLFRLESGAATPADLAPLAHELTDLLYVAYGALLALGVDPDAAFAEVHRANVTKAGGPRRPDGKVLKPPGWQAADLRRVIESAT